MGTEWIKDVKAAMVAAVPARQQAVVLELCRSMVARDVAKATGLDESTVRAIRDAAGLKPLGPTGFLGVVIPE